SLSEQSALQSFQHFRRICDLAAVQRPTPNLIVWPENSCPEYWLESPGGHPDANSMKFAHQAGQIWKTNLLFGMEAYVLGLDKKALRFNSSVLVLAGATCVAVCCNVNIHCVPLGAYYALVDTV